MPTFSPVPSSFTTLPHRRQALVLYRHILREGAKFFDERTSHWVQSRAQEAFRKNRILVDENRIQKSMSDARKALRSLERANQMDLKAVMRLLRLTYGIQGVERRKLLQPFMDSARMRTISLEKLSAAASQSGSNPRQSGATPPFTQQASFSASHLSDLLSQLTKDPQPLHFKNARTVPPILSAPVVSLIKSVAGKSAEPTLPEPLFKPLHGKREANLRWRFFIKQMAKVTPPLPSDIRQEMEWKSRVGQRRLNRLDNAAVKPQNPSTIFASTSAGNDAHWDEWEQRILQTIKAWNRNGTARKEERWEAGRFHPSIGGKPAKSNTLTPRLYRRIWQHLLDEVPIMDVKLTAQKPSSPSTGNNAETSSVSPSFKVSKSLHSYQARYGAGLKLQAKVNSFDRLGYVENPAPTGQKGRNKAPKAGP